MQTTTFNMFAYEPVSLFNSDKIVGIGQKLCIFLKQRGLPKFVCLTPTCLS